MFRNLVYIAASSLLALAIVACGGDSDAEGSPLGNDDNGDDPTASSAATATAPAGASSPEATEAPANGGTGGEGTYTVQPGDTLAAIAQQFGVTVQEIVDANDIANPDVIRPGQVLEIPQ